MSDPMSRGALIVDLKAILSDAQDKFTAPGNLDFIRHLDVAAMDLGRHRPRTLVGKLTLVADQAEYAAPADLIRPKQATLDTVRRNRVAPWDRRWAGPLPRLRLVESSSVRTLYLDPAPDARLVDLLAGRYDYFYFAGHVVADTGTSVSPGDRHLLLIRAAAQALQELAHRNISKPVQLGGSAGVGAMPKNGTPANLSAALMSLYERMAA